MKQLDKAFCALANLEQFARNMQQLRQQKLCTTKRLIVFNFEEEFSSVLLQIPEIHEQLVLIRRQRILFSKEKQRADKKLKRLLKRKNNAVKMVKQQGAIAYIDDIFEKQLLQIDKISCQIAGLIRQVGAIMAKFGVMCRCEKRGRSERSSPDNQYVLPQVEVV